MKQTSPERPVKYCSFTLEFCLLSYVEGLAELVVRNGKDIAQLQEQGNRVRKVASTEMNQRSSRSHSVFSLHIKQRDTDGADDQGLKAKINLVDLAGSERADFTGAQGQTLKEGAAINKRCTDCEYYCVEVKLHCAVALLSHQFCLLYFT